MLLATGALAYARYAATPPVYVASQALAILVAPPDTSTTITSYSQGVSAQQAAQLAQLLTTPAFLTSSAVESDISARLQAIPGDGATRAATPAQIGQALSAQLGAPSGQNDETGAALTLTARWSTAVGAQAVLAAATATLQFDATQLVQGVIAATGATGATATTTAAPDATPTTVTNAPVTAPLAAGDLIGAEALGAPTSAARDAALAAAARTLLYEQLALALVVALLLGGALQWALVRRRG